MSKNALASLTANYTDSENEDDQADENAADEDSNESQVIIISRPATPVKVKSAQSTPSKVEAKSGFKLVNYHDDTVLSDDESDSSNDDNDGNGEKADENLEQDVDMEATKDNAKDTITKRDRAAEYGFQLPPETKGKCPQELQDKITNMYDKMRTNNMDMNKLIQQRKEFRNPSIYEKLIQFCEIDELGTNYPPELYDPLQWTGKDSFYEELAMVQKLEMEKREKEMSKAEPMKKAEDDSKKRKSKWDQPLPNSVTVQQPTVIKPTSLITTSITGTKGTVISAFGSLPKKSKP